MQAHQGKHSHSKQQSKRYKASGPATATCTPVPPQTHTLALCRPKCHVRRRWRATYEETSEGARTAAGCKADLTSTTSLPAPPLPRCPTYGYRPWGHVPPPCCRFCAYVTCVITKTAQYQ